MFAVTPAPELLIAFTRSVSVSTPLPVVMVVAVPPLGVMVMVSAGKSVVPLATASEEKDAVVARLLTTITLFPVTAPDVAVAVTTLEFEELTVVLDNEPVRLLSACASLSRFVAAVWIAVNAELWLDSVLSCDCHVSSGASAAVTAAFTASVTSMPGVDEPVAASKMLLRSMELAAFDEESNDDDIEPIKVAFSSARTGCDLVRPV